MDNTKVLKIAQIVVSILLIVSVLLQNRSDDSPGLSGGASGGEIFKTRQGLEKWLDRITVGLAIAFVALAILALKI